MAEYIFYDWDDVDNLEYTIEGEAYTAFLDTCFRYAHSVGFQIDREYDKDLSAILPYQIPITDTIQKEFGVHCYLDPQDPLNEQKYTYSTVMLFLLTPEVKKFILEQTDHIFGWTYFWENENPDDLSFFREDGSVLFSSVIHEGYCNLYPKDGEDFSEILKDERWILCNPK